MLRQKTSYRRTPSREAQIILTNWHFFGLRVLFLLCLAFLLVSGWLRLCFSACGGGRLDGERNMLESYVWGGILRMCSAMFALAVVFPCFCPPWSPNVKVHRRMLFHARFSHASGGDLSYGIHAATWAGRNIAIRLLVGDYGCFVAVWERRI